MLERPEAESPAVVPVFRVWLLRPMRDLRRAHAMLRRLPNKYAEPMSSLRVFRATVGQSNPGACEQLCCRCRDNLKESNMNRLLMSTAVAVLLGLSPALAADDSALQSDKSAMQPPTQSGVTNETAKSATEPESGTADTSGAARERSSAPPQSGAASADKPDESAMNPSSGSADTSSGAKEQSSAPPGSSASDTSKPNPTLGADSPKSDYSKE
jgi:hypothetical protein